MFFENEKDTINDGADIQITDDGTVIWDDVLNTSDDNDIIVIDDDDDTLKEEAKDEEINIPADLTDEVSDDELLNILNDTSTAAESNDLSSEESVMTDDSVQYENNGDEEFDLDKQLENINFSGDDSSVPDVTVPEKKQGPKISSTIVLIALLFALLFAGGIYYLVNYFKNQDVSNGELTRNQTVEDTMNNVTKEDIEQRNDEDNNEGIPVVNEDETGLIKPDEKEEEEKKEVITVIPTGRSNPFMPIQKYVKVEIPETVVRYDRANLIKPPKEYGVENEATTKMLTISVSGIMYDAQKPSAIISFENNDYFVQRGDKLDDYRVVDIGKNYVTVALGKNLYKANVGEEFKLADPYGSAKYLTDKYGGGRQYRSVNLEASNSTTEKKEVSPTNRYVSDSDVEINVK